MNSESDKLKSSLPLDTAQLTSKNLAKQIFQAELPEQFIKTIPAQTLFAAVKRNGLHSSGDLIEIASIEQVRLLIDFDCWDKSYFSEESFWAWLSLPDDQDGLGLLQKIVKCVDLKLIALILSRHVLFETFEEATDNPPAPGSYTPDKGRTWITINIEDANQHFLLGRLLALLFETNADLFYQLLSITTTATASELEEESYQDKLRRISAEGIPSDEAAHQINSPISEKEVSFLILQAEEHAALVDIRAVEPLIYDTKIVQPLSSLLNDISLREDLESEITYILNAAIVCWGVDFSEYEHMLFLSEKVKGCLNLGLERALELGAPSASRAFQILGAQKLYRLGMEQLKNYRSRAKSLSQGINESVPIESEVQVVLDLAKNMFPEMPKFLKQSMDDTATSSELRVEAAAIEHLSELQNLRKFLEEKLTNQIN